MSLGRSIRIMARMARRLVSILLLLALGATARAGEYWVSDSDEVFGDLQHVKARYEDTFIALARTYDVGFESLRRANPGVDPWLPGRGTEITIPTRFVLPRAPRRGIIVNVAELRLYYFPEDSGTPPPGVPAGARRVVTHPISVGRMDWSTPLGVTKVTARVANPELVSAAVDSGRARGARRRVAESRAARPRQPARQPCACVLALPGYLIHGTNMPSGVGMRVTHGCIRLFPEDIEALYKSVPDRHRRPDRESAGQARLDGRRRAVSRVAPAVGGEPHRRRERRRGQCGARVHAGIAADEPHARLCRGLGGAPHRSALGRCGADCGGRSRDPRGRTCGRRRRTPRLFQRRPASSRSPSRAGKKKPPIRLAAL